MLQSPWKDLLTVKKFIKNTSGNRGFSLVEIIVVLAIMGIMLAVSMPSIVNYYPHMQLKGTSMELYAALQKARSKAIGSTSQYGVQIDLDATPQTHQIVTRLNAGAVWEPDSSSAEQVIPALTLIRSMLIGVDQFNAGTGGARIISFTPVGTATQATINLENRRDGADIYQVTVTRMTGRVRIVAGGGA